MRTSRAGVESDARRGNDAPPAWRPRGLAMPGGERAEESGTHGANAPGGAVYHPDLLQPSERWTSS